MKPGKTTRSGLATDDFIRVMTELSGRRDRVLQQPELDLAALAILTGDYEAAGLTCAAVELQKRLEWYRKKCPGE